MVVAKNVLQNNFDEKGFLQDVLAAKSAVGEASEEDAQHLQKLVMLTRILAAGGHLLLCAGCCSRAARVAIACCGLSVLMISFTRCVRWTVIGHHVSHGGYDKVHKNCASALPHQYHRGRFATGARRMLDWLDWMLPEAWDVEHNKMHHYYLSEDKDPDVVERNFELLRNMPVPSFMKYASMLMWIVSWKVTYYSPNTFKELQLSRRESWIARSWPAARSKTEPLTVFDFVKCPFEEILCGRIQDALFWPIFFFQWIRLIVPMFIMVFFPVVVPLVLKHTLGWPLLVSCEQVTLRALVSVTLAEMLTNAHSFIIIACNHSGDDLYRYTTSCKAYSAEWFLRCAYSSANFETGSDLVDITYGWLNYQIEHHMFPDMTPLQYRKLQPLIKSVCKKHGVQYVQQNALVRTWKMIQVAVGATSMKQCTGILDRETQPNTLMGG